MYNSIFISISLITFIIAGVILGSLIFGLIHDWKIKKYNIKLSEKCICGHNMGWHTYYPDGKLLLGNCYSVGCTCNKFILSKKDGRNI